MASLTQNDKRALTILLTALVLFVIVQFAFFPLLNKRKENERKIQGKEKELVEMQSMQEEITQLSQRSNTLEQLVAARIEPGPQGQRGRFLCKSSSQMSATASLGARQSPRGDSACATRRPHDWGTPENSRRPT